MRGYIIKTKAFTLQVRYLKRKSSGLYYFRRGIPEDLRRYFGGRLEIVESLHTYNELEAVKAARLRAKQVEDKFRRLRTGASVNDEAERIIYEAKLEPKPISQQSDDESMYQFEELMREIGDSIAEHDGEHVHYNEHNLDPVFRRMKQIFEDVVPLTLSDAKSRQLRLHDGNPNKLEEIERFFSFFIKELKEDEIGKISRESVEKLIEEMGSSGLKSATIKKYILTVRMGVGELISFNGSHLLNPFEGLHIPRLGTDGERRHTFTPAELQLVCQMVRDKPDLVTSQLIGLFINTGCRSHELAGLSVKNINLTHRIPHIHIESQPNRKIKNKYSSRYIPLVGISLECAKRLLLSVEEGQVYAFPNWNPEGKLITVNPTAAVKNALRKVVQKGTSHSFRHTMNTRLKESGVNKEGREDLQGWSSEGMSRHYGTPDMLPVNLRTLKKMLRYENSGKGRYRVT